MKNRMIALLLCLLIAGSMQACGDEASPADNSTTESDHETTVADDGQPRSGVPDSVDYGGETIRILNGYYMEKQIAYLNVAELNGIVMDDAVYNRNMAVMENLGVTLEFYDFDIWNNYGNVRNSILADEDAWDFLMGMQYRITELTPEGIFMDIKDAPYIDIEQPWWSTQFIENLNIGEKHRYLLSGDYSIGHLNQYGAIFYNKNMYENYYGDPDGLYDIVLDGKWTLDKMYEVTSEIAKDLNGDGKIEWDKDEVGFAIRSTAFQPQHMVYDAGASLTVYKDGTYSFDGLTETNVSIVEKVSRLLTDNPGYAEIPKTGNIWDNDITGLFADGRMLIMTGLLSYADLLRDMDDDYGVIPYPTLNEGQDYRALVHNQAMTLAVPITNKNLEMTAAVMEEMAFLGWRDMLPVYYEIVLKQKYMRDGQDKAMQIMDIIHDSAWTELAFTYDSYISLVMPVLHYSTFGDGNISSNYARSITAANVKLEDLVAFFDED